MFYHFSVVKFIVALLFQASGVFKPMRVFKFDMTLKVQTRDPDQGLNLYLSIPIKIVFLIKSFL